MRPLTAEQSALLEQRRQAFGRFAAPRTPGARVDPFEVAADYVDAGPGRDLGALLGATAARCGVR